MLKLLLFPPKLFLPAATFYLRLQPLSCKRRQNFPSLWARTRRPGNIFSLGKNSQPAATSPGQELATQLRLKACQILFCKGCTSTAAKLSTQPCRPFCLIQLRYKYNKYYNTNTSRTTCKILFCEECCV